MTFTPDQLALLAKPFALHEHGFNDGKAYIRKSAIRNRLNQVDPSWSLGAPEFVAEAGDVVIFRGSLTVCGVTRWGLGSGTIIRKRKDGTAIEGLDLAAQVTKAYKAAASDILARAAVEFTVGQYMKDKPASVKEAGFRDWLEKLGQPPAPTGWASAATVNSLLDRALKGLGLTWTDISRYVGIGKSDDYAAWNAKYASLAAAGDAIKSAHEAEMADLPPATPKQEELAEIPY